MPANEIDQPAKPDIIPVCLVTGGSSGIGRAIALKFAGQGYRIAICGRQRSQLDATSEQIKQVQRDLLGDAQYPFCIAEVADLNEPQQATQFVDSVFRQFGRVDVLINNAGAAPLAPFASITANEFERTLNINIRSVFYLTQRVWNLWKDEHIPSYANREKSIINISSLAAVDPFPHFSIYGASKSWLDLMTHALAAEGEPLGIRICSIRPGAVETGLLRALFPDFPADQCATPEDVAELAWKCVALPQAYPSGKAFRLPDKKSSLAP